MEIKLNLNPNFVCFLFYFIDKFDGLQIKDLVGSNLSAFFCSEQLPCYQFDKGVLLKTFVDTAMKQGTVRHILRVVPMDIKLRDLVRGEFVHCSIRTLCKKVLERYANQIFMQPKFRTHFCL